MNLRVNKLLIAVCIFSLLLIMRGYCVDGEDEMFQISDGEIVMEALKSGASLLNISQVSNELISQIDTKDNQIKEKNKIISTNKNGALRNKISFDAKGMDIIDVLKLLAEQGNLNLVIGKNDASKVSIFLKDVNVWDAFEIIIAANDLAYEKQGYIIKVMTARDYELNYGAKFLDKKRISTVKLKFARAEEVNKVLNQVKTPLGRIVADVNSNTVILLDTPESLSEMEKIIAKMDSVVVTKVFELSYGDSEKLNTLLQEAVTKGVGVVKHDPRTNKIVVIDYPHVVAQIDQIIEAFDAKTRQVLIEAKIIQVNLSDDYEMGIDWEYMITKNLDLKAFNLARGHDNSGSSVTLGTTTPAEEGDYQFILNMLKTFGDTKTLSTPRITATNGQEAKILVGSKEVYASNTVVQGDTTQTIAENINFVDVGVKLYVTPTINKDGFISMKIRPEVSSTSATPFLKQDGTEVPIVETSEAETSLLVKDGVTIIMGGLMKNQVSKTVHKVPLFGEIPFLGKLFTRTDESTTKTELVIFLTPHIISGTESTLEKSPFNEIELEKSI